MSEEVREVLARLQARGWTLSAIADTMEFRRNTVAKWKSGERNPSHEALVVAALKKLETRKRIPKRKRYPQGRSGGPA